MNEDIRLVDWINDQDWADFWDNVPVVSKGGKLRMATYEDSAFLRACPPIPASDLIKILEDSKLLERLTGEYPGVINCEWFAPEIEAEKIIIFDGEMPYSNLLNRLWNMVEEDCEGEFKHIQPHDPEAKAYSPDKEDE